MATLFKFLKKGLAKIGRLVKFAEEWISKNQGWSIDMGDYSDHEEVLTAEDLLSYATGSVIIAQNLMDALDNQCCEGYVSHPDTIIDEWLMEDEATDLLCTKPGSEYEACYLSIEPVSGLDEVEIGDAIIEYICASVNHFKIWPAGFVLSNEDDDVVIKSEDFAKFIEEKDWGLLPKLEKGVN